MTRLPLAKALLGVAGVTALLLLMPLVAMQFTREVAWGPGDFLVAAVLLFSAGTAMVIAVRRTKRIAARVSAVAIVTFVLAAVWAELAVGIFH